MYKNKDKQRTAERDRQRRYRKGVTALEEQGVTEGSCDDEGVTTQSLSYPDIIDKLTDKVWRTKLEVKDIIDWMKQSIEASYQGAKNYAEAGYQDAKGYRLLGRTGQAFQIVLEKLEQECTR